MPLHKHFERICELRQLRLAEVARRANVNQGTITKLKQGTTDPQLELVRKVARILEVTIDYISGEKGQKMPTKQHLAIESLELFSRKANLSPEIKRELETMAADPSSPTTIEEWQNHVDRLKLVNRLDK